jgi:hypothetical protein
MDQPFCRLIDWLIDWLILFYVPLENFALIIYGGVTIAGQGPPKFRPMFGAQGLWARKNLYHVTSAVTWDLGFTGLNRRPAQLSHLLRQVKRCWGRILTRILPSGPFTEKLNLVSLSTDTVARQAISFDFLNVQ